MKKLILIAFTVLVVLGNYAAWNTLRADEVRNTEGYELALCYQALSYAQGYMDDKATDEQLKSYYQGRTAVQNKQRELHKAVPINKAIEAFNNHKMYVAFAKRDFSKMGVNQKQAKATECALAYGVK